MDEYVNKSLRCDHLCVRREVDVVREHCTFDWVVQESPADKGLSVSCVPGAKKKPVCLLYTLVGRRCS